MVSITSCIKDATTHSPTTQKLGRSFDTKTFLENYQYYKNGDLNKRTEEEYSTSEVVDIVETTMNETYGEGSRLFYDQNISTDTFSVYIDSDVILETDLYEFYDDALYFASVHFYGLEEEEKVPKGFDIEFLSTTGNEAFFEVTSIVELGTEDMSFSRKTFTGNDNYYIDGTTLGCGMPSALDGRDKLQKYATYNLRPSPYFTFYFTEIGVDYEFSHNFSPMWYFTCRRNASPPATGCCSSCDACSSYDLSSLRAAYCLDTDDMNDNLDALEFDLATDIIPSGKKAMSVLIFTNVHCSQFNNSLFDNNTSWFEDLEVRIRSGVKNIRISGTPATLPTP